MRFIKKTLKAILPAPFLEWAISIRDNLQFRTLPQRTFDPSLLRAAKDIALADIFADTDIETAWKEDSAGLINIYGPDDKLGGVNPGDRRALYYLIMGLKPQSVLEVGTYIGTSTLHIASALKRLKQNGKITTVDIVDSNHPKTGPWKDLGLAKPPADLASDLECRDYIDFQARDCLQFMANTNERYDLIFLDGSHAAKSVYQEISLALPLLSENGILLLHDFYPEGKALYPNSKAIPGPFQALERIKKENPQIAMDSLPLGALPWPTKQGTNLTSLSLVVKP